MRKFLENSAPWFITALLITMTPGAWSRIPDFSLAGFATLNGGTTGGAGGIEVTVSSYADLERYAEESDAPYMIYVRGRIAGTGSVAGGDYEGSVKVRSNKSIIGLDSTVYLDGVGLTMQGGSNIIVRNLTISFIGIADSIPEGSHDIPGIYSEFGDEGRAQILVNGGDLISIRGESHNIWIDHCELYSEDPGVQTNQDLYDGLIDIIHQTGFITISWCYFHDHHKTHLVGSNDYDLYADRKITFHHNRYENVSSRLPFYRGAVGHVFNNYIYRGLSGCVNPRLGACLRVEKNFFGDSKNTIFSKHGGFAQRIDNREVNCTNPEAYPEDCIASIDYPYEHVLTSDVDSVRELVMKYAGTGKLVGENTAVVQDPVEGQILVYPNSSRDRLYICSLPSKEMDLELINPTGQLVLQRKISGSQPIDLMSLGRGLYFLRLTCGNITINHKIIVE